MTPEQRDYVAQKYGPLVGFSPLLGRVFDCMALYEDLVGRVIPTSGSTLVFGLRHVFYVDTDWVGFMVSKPAFMRRGTTESREASKTELKAHDTAEGAARLAYTACDPWSSFLGRAL